MINHSNLKDCIISNKQENKKGAIEFTLKDDDYSLIYKISQEKN